MYTINQINGKIPTSDVIDPETINSHDLCYQCPKHGPDCLLGKSRINYFNDEPHLPKTIKLILSQIEMNTLFRTINKRKRIICDKSIHNAMIITFDINQTNKKFYVTVQPQS